jgi:uncharacterized protein
MTPRRSEHAGLEPLPDPDTAPFWLSTAVGELRCGRCGSCRGWQHPPLERCRVCGGDIVFEPISGLGRVVSFIVNHRNVIAGIERELPYITAVVELEEQPDLRWVGLVEADSLKIGQQVRAQLRPISGGSYFIPVFGVTSSP